ncbi:TerB family tellurite resistance protein [Dyadobacter sandarakinus]|uniref:TerB family tellurite resistance protein n=2 Tax=Dyadobacter sandarakinus TaxID=2747268 RepID=A0ABX7I619_9BACT|nr:TerB family tellurite resistance protein [Dyadobacter sandarakinus]
MRHLLILILLGTMLISLNRASAQTPEVTQLILNIQKLNQLRKILKELKAGYDILFKGYTTIKDISKGNFKLHEAFLDGLLEVSPAVKRYKRIAEIIDFQLKLVSEYRAAFGHFQSGKYFNKDELDYMERVYARLINQSLKNLDALTMVVTAKKMRMSDDERLSAIDKIHEEMQDKLVFLRHFNSTAATLGMQRAKVSVEVESSAQLNGIQL